MSIRTLLPMERSKFAEHLKRLDWNDRLARFESSVSDEYIDKYVAGIGPRDVILGYFDDECVLRGAAHIAFARDIADLGLSIEAGHRRQGLGTTLLERSIDYSRFRVSRFSSQCLTHNRWMMNRLRRMGFVIEVDFDTAHAETDLNPADITLTFRAMTQENLGWFSYNTKLIFRSMPFGTEVAA